MKMASNKGTKAGIYVRISRDFTHERMGVQRQIEDCQAICEWNNYEIYKTYEDNDISAYGAGKGKTKNRPQYNQMLKDYKQGKIDVIVVWNIDRLTRDLLSFEESLKELQELDVLICSSDLGAVELNLSDPEDRLRAQQLVMYAQFESARKSKRTKRANKQRAENGIMRKGSRLYGYDLKGNIIPEEAEVVKEIYKNYAKGSSIGTITRALAGHDDGSLPNLPKATAPSINMLLEKEERDREKGIEPLERGDEYLAYREKVMAREWQRSTTSSILWNPRYAGFVYRAEVTRDGKCQTYNSSWSDFIIRDPETGEYVKGDWEPIIDTDLWWEVQHKREHNYYLPNGERIDKRGHVKKHLGAGLYRCSVCGKPMKTGGGGATRKQKYYCYRCDGHINRMGQKIDEFVINVVREFLGRPDFKDLLLKPVDNSPRMAEIDKQLMEVNNQLNQTKKMFIDKRDGFDSDFVNLIEERMASLKTERAILEEEKASLLPSSQLDGIFDAPDPVAAFDEMTDIAQKTKIVDFLCTVTLKPHKRGERVTPESMKEDVIIEWKQY